ncbi:multiple epidermal growth factor-like domains protein 10 [Mya arenaria]|uniref:multiple epidermal growth factor-like domains protein 10 n=1 Tax=Mya arenaria TaxID=6604 RepID=UPI0022E4AEAB|nr:multiple epidermal growth factor-like domains protein 10 [Mya arenaria]
MVLCEVKVSETDCPIGTYGDKCSESCGHCRGGSKQCDYVNGTCKMGCETGYVSLPCLQEINILHLQMSLIFRRRSYYGENCAKRCGNCLDGSRCDLHNGSCPGKCSPGYLGLYCNQSCNNSYYGENCAQLCGNCLEGARCDLQNGNCPFGCSAGHSGVFCNQSCNSSYYGENCAHRCGNCKEGSRCDLKSGNCPCAQTAFTVMVAPPNAVSVGTLLSVIKYQETFEQEDVSGDTKESDVIQHVRLVDMVKNARTTAVGIVGTKNPVDLQRVFA